MSTYIPPYQENDHKWFSYGEVPSKLLLLFYSCKPQYYVFLPEMNMVGDVQYVQHVNMGNAANDHHTSTPTTPPVTHIIK